MKLTNLKINNFRGIDEIEINVQDITTLIGQNNCGKSSILRAVQLLCNNVSPELEEFKNKNHELPIEIIGTFEDIQEWERHTPGVAGLISENRIVLRYTATVEDLSKEKVEKEYDVYKKTETITGWAESWSDITNDIKELAVGIGITTAAHFRTSANKEKIRVEIREKRADLITQGDYEWTNENVSIGPALQQALPKAILIPAVRDASDETKAGKTAKSAFGELINQLILPKIKFLPEYAAIQVALDQLELKMSNPEALPEVQAVNEQITKRLKDLIPVESKLTLSDPDLDSALMTSVGIRIADGVHATPVHLQGHGLQRTLIFTLLEIIAERNAASGEADRKNTIILFEEPELYMHPQMLRKLKRILFDISNQKHWQVVCSTHSPFLIEVDQNPMSLIILRKHPETKVVSKSQLDKNPFPDGPDVEIEKEALRAALDFHPTVSEVFFSTGAVLVEGDTEVALLRHCPTLLNAVGIDLQVATDTTIISCGGKWTIPAIARLLKAFGIPFKVVHDMDRKGLTDAQLKEVLPIHPFKANEKIAGIAGAGNVLVNEDTIEHLWKGDSSTAKPYNAVKTVATIIEKGELDNFPKLKQFVEFCFR